MSKKYERHFCKTPFTYYELSITDDTKHKGHLCCPSWVPESTGNAEELSPFEAWNSETAQKIRQSIHDGDYSYCVESRCDLMQSNTLPLKEDIEDPYLKSIIENKTVKLERGPEILSMALDYSCNLSCPSCRPHQIVAPEKDRERILKTYEKNLKVFLPTLKQLTSCNGGDPFASKVYWNILTNLDPSGSKDFKVELQTNGLLINPQTWAKLSNIHRNISTLSISIDAATYDTYSIVRRGGDFNKLLKSLDFVAELRASSKIDFVRILFVVQRDNFYEIPEFIELGKKFGFDEVRFRRIEDWSGNFSVSFQDMAIYLDTHPKNQEFVDVLSCDEILDPIAQPANITSFLPEHIKAKRDEFITRSNEIMEKVEAYDKEGLKLLKDLVLEYPTYLKNIEILFKHYLFNNELESLEKLLEILLEENKLYPYNCKRLKQIQKNISFETVEYKRKKARDLVSDGKISEAMNIYMETKEKSEKPEIDYTELGWMNNHFGKCKEALKMYKKAYDLNSQYFYAVSGLGSTFHYLGDNKKARKYLNESLDLSPSVEETNRILELIKQAT